MLNLAITAIKLFEEKFGLKIFHAVILSREREVHLHGWVYGLHNGLVKDLSVIHNNKEDIDPIYRFSIPKKNKK